MNKKLKNAVVTVVLAVWIFGLSVWGIISPDREVSLSERRKLAQMPTANKETLTDGSFTSDFEKYSADQFPLRDGFRRIKSVGEYYLFRQLDSNNIYLYKGYASKLEYPLKPESLKKADERFDYIYETYLKDSGGKVFLSIIPDKNYFMAESGGYPHLDFEEMVNTVTENADYAEYIDIFPTLELSDYYKTDTHWRQEKLSDTVKALADGLGVTLSAEYTEKEISNPFYGVYYGQSALPLPGEKMYYLDSEIFDGVTVYNAETEKVMPVYTLENADGDDPYEIYLDGSRSLITIGNPNASTDKELIIFRDSYGSAIAPLLIEAYSKITLVDIRYLPSPNLKFFVDFDGADTLFLYSTLILNNAETLR